MWIALAGVWIFLSVALGSFDSGDWPSHTVAVHNEPTRNLCGVVGALIAYWSYHVIGLGSWVLLAGIAGYLGVRAAGRPVTHTPVRACGMVFMALAFSGFHGLFASDAGVLAGSKPGLLSVLLVGELGVRFSVFGTFLILLACFAVGAIVSVDRLVLAIPRTMLRTMQFTRRASQSPRRLLRNLRARPEAALASGSGAKVREAHTDVDDGIVLDGEPADDSEYEYEYVYEDEDGEDDPEAEYEYVDEDEEDVEASSEPTRATLTAEELRAKIAKLPLRMAGTKQAVARDEDIPREENFEGYEFPTLDLLEDPQSNYSEKMEQFVRKQAEQLEETLQTYRIDGEVVGIESGPVVTLYSVQLAPGTKVSKVQAIASDLARSLRAHNIRIVPNTVGKTTIGIEVPNLYKERVRLKELMSGGQAEGMILPMFLGKDASGEPLVADLTRMPHMLIAGTTGSGKSVCMNTIIMSWLYTKRPDELKLILVDPKMVELSQFQDIPHLMCPVVTETSRAAAILEWAVDKMEERYELLREAVVRNIGDYNALDEDELVERFNPANEVERAKIPKKMPYIVFIIDELADLIMTHKDVEHAVVRIAQKARAVGIHLMLATQRPQANVVTGLIKSNMPCRVSFKVASGMDSRIVLDQKGAELLLGQGDMLFLTPHTSEVKRAQGTLVTDQEIRKVVKFLREVASPQFERSLIAVRPGADEPTGDNPAERDPMFEQAVEIMIESGRGSVSLLQRRLAIGYSRSSRLVDQMYQAGILGDHKGSVAREVMLTMDEWEQMKAMEQAAEASGTLFDGDEEPTPIIETTTSSEAPSAAATDDVTPHELSDSDDEQDADDDVDIEAQSTNSTDDDDADEEDADVEYEYEYVDEEGNPIDPANAHEYEFVVEDEDEADDQRVRAG